MCPGGASVILLVVIGLCGSNLLLIQNMNIITIVFKVGLIDVLTLFYELYQKTDIKTQILTSVSV